RRGSGGRGPPGRDHDRDHQVGAGMIGMQRLDLATVLGLISGFVLIALAVVMGGSPATFVDVPSMLIVLGGTAAVTTVSFSVAEVVKAQRVLLQVLFNRLSTPEAAGR